MAQLPTPGQDNGIWGNMLNTFLLVSHNGDGTLQLGAISTAGGYIKPNSGIPLADLDTSTQSIIQSVASKYVKPPSGIPSSDMTSAVQTSLGLANTSVQLGGDIGGSTTSPTLTKIQGTVVNASTPTNGQVLAYNSTSSAWVPSTVSSTTVSDATTSSKGIVELAGDLAGTATTPVIKSLQGVGVPMIAPTAAGQVLTTTGSGSGASTTWATPSVTSVNSQTGAVVVNVASLGDTTISLPTNNQVLAYNSTTSKWVNQTPASGVQLDTSGSDIQADTTTGAAVAGSTGKAADAGHQHALATHDHTTANRGGQIPIGGLATTGTASNTTYLRGDGTWSTPNSGSSTLASDTDVSIATPTNNQVLTYNSTTSKWVNQTPAAAPDATTTSKGIIELAGDLGGTATSPTLANTTNVQSVVNTVISSNATVTGALQQNNNLSDIKDAGSSRANIRIPSLTPAACVATSNVTLSGFQTVDGYTLASGDLVLLTAQTTASQNGLWTAASGSWTRPTEFTTGITVKGRTCAVLNGTTYANSNWILNAPTAGVVVDTGSQIWSESIAKATSSKNIAYSLIFGG